MKYAGGRAVSDDGRPVKFRHDRRACICLRFDLPVSITVKIITISGGVMHEGRVSLRLGLKGMPALAEEIDAVRDILIAEETGARVHIAHVSTKGTVEAIRRAKAAGIGVTCEVTPHHFTLPDTSVEGYDTNTKMAPPLRSDEHLQAILDGLRDGTIDASHHHAPTMPMKGLEFDRAPFGITAFERYRLVLTSGYTGA